MVQSEISCLRQQLQEKETLVKVLHGQIEELEKKRRTPSPLRPRTTETQTSQVNGQEEGSQEDTDAPPARKKAVHSKKACCAIL